MRALTPESLQGLEAKMRGCFAAGAVATGCEHEIAEAAPPYAELTPDHWLAEVFREEMTTMGRSPVPTEVEAVMPLGSTDMGNVTQLLPGIHPVVGVESNGAVIHQPGSPSRRRVPAGTVPSPRVRSCWRAPWFSWRRHPTSEIGCWSCAIVGGVRA